MQSTLDLAERISRISESSTMKVAAEADRLRTTMNDMVEKVRALGPLHWGQVQEIPAPEATPAAQEVPA